MKAGWIVAGVLAVLAVPVVASAQGIIGGVTGGVKGALGVPKKKTKTKKPTNT